MISKNLTAVFTREGFVDSHSLMSLVGRSQLCREGMRSEGTKTGKHWSHQASIVKMDRYVDTASAGPTG
jgi:hypothetical protein